MKKLLSILLVLVLCTGLVAMVASAEGGPTISVSSHELKEGTKTVTVTVTMSDNDGIGALSVNPVYDAEVLKMTDFKWYEDAAKGFTWMGKFETGASFVNAGGSTYNGKLAEFTFEVLKDNLQGKSTEVGVKYQATTTDYKMSEGTVNGTVKFLCTHKYEVTATTAGDCVTKGTETTTCSKCGDVQVKDTKLGDHSTEEKTTPATCEVDGKVETVCTICDKVIKTTKIAKLGHSWDEGTVTTEPTCTEKGVKTFTCKNDAAHTKTEAIAALGHTAGEAVTENEVAPTCEKTGSKDTVVYCSVCNAELSRKTETSKAIGHDWELTGTTASKCGEAGTNTYTCKNDATHVKTETVAALEHQWDEGTVTTAPTCTEKGVKTYTCTRGCGATKTEDVKELGHTKAEAVKENEVAPTCTVAGSYDEVVYCSVCNEKLSTKTVSVKATGHAWATEGTVKTPATCYAEGVMSYACNNGCGETKEEAIKKTAHTVTNWTHEDEVYCIGTCDVAECGAAVKERHDVKEYVQNEKGEYIGTCVVCGQNNVNKGNMIPAGDITPVLVMGGVAMLSMLAAAAYVTYRKFAR